MHLGLKIFAVFLLPASLASAQGAGGATPEQFSRAQIDIENGEEILIFRMPTVRCYSRPKDMSLYYKTVRNVKKVYPIAKEAERLLAEIEGNIDSLSTNRAQRAFIKQREDELLAEYTPILKEMTFSQGKILIKLLDRQTDRTGYSIVKELRGGFSAGIYQGIGRIFGMNLKDRYDKDGEDQLIEEIIEMYELGLL